MSRRVPVYLPPPGPRRPTMRIKPFGALNNVLGLAATEGLRQPIVVERTAATKRGKRGITRK